MTQNPSLPPPILTILGELFTIMVSFMDTESQLALACTCKTVYNYHKQQCKEQIVPIS